jgi:diacylglycerol kinase (ATP)
MIPFSGMPDQRGHYGRAFQRAPESRIMATMVHPDSWFVIVNPVSGGGRTRRHLPRLCAALDRRRLPHECVTTTAAGDARRLVTKALADGHRRLLALGGDGSFHELVNGLVAQAEVPPAQCLVAVAAHGTGNDWARTMQVPDDPEQLAACMARARGRRVDLGMAEDARGQRLAFHNVAGAGLDAEVLRRLPRRGPRILAYLAGLARTLPRYRAPEFELTIDGRQQSGRFLLVLAANGPRCGGGMRLAGDAALDDGWLDLVTVAPVSVPRAMAALPKLFDGRLAGHPAFRVVRCRSVTIHARPPCGVELDGQPAGETPVRLSLLPAALQALDCRGSAE